MNKKDAQIKILALALYEIRVALSHHLGSKNEETRSEAFSAHLAYALHNDALAIIEDREDDFDINESISSIEKVDKIFGEKFSKRFKELITK